MPYLPVDKRCCRISKRIFFLESWVGHKSKTGGNTVTNWLIRSLDVGTVASN